MRDIAVSPDGQLIASGADYTVRVWETETGHELYCISEHLQTVSSVTFAPNGLRIASGSWDKTVLVWDAHTGEQILRMRGHDDRISSVTYAPDGRCIASTDGKTLRLWDAESGEQLRCLRTPGHVYDLAFASDGQRLALACDDRTVRIWHAPSGRELHCLGGHEEDVFGVVFSCDGQHIVSGAGDRTVRVWDTQTGKQVRCLHGHEGGVQSVAYAVGGRKVLSAGGREDHTVRVWDYELADDSYRVRGHEYNIQDLVFSPDGRWLLSVGLDGVRVWDPSNGLQVRFRGAHELFKGIRGVAFAADAGHFVTWDQSLTLWDADQCKAIRHFRIPYGSICTSAFSRDSRRIVAGIEQTVDDQTLHGEINVIAVWDIATGECLEVRGGSADRFTQISGEAYFPPGHVHPRLETPLQLSKTARVMWFPHHLDHPRTHPSARTWSGITNDYLAVLTIDGTP